MISKRQLIKKLQIPDFPSSQPREGSSGFPRRTLAGRPPIVAAKQSRLEFALSLLDRSMIRP